MSSWVEGVNLQFTLTWSWRLQKFGNAKQNVESANVVTEKGKVRNIAWHASALRVLLRTSLNKLFNVLYLSHLSSDCFEHRYWHRTMSLTTYVASRSCYSVISQDSQFQRVVNQTFITLERLLQIADRQPFIYAMCD